MLKITKGLKKKKKGKKSKHKEEELFKPEELEAYRREHQQQSAHESESSASAAGDNDEWKKFQALTAGVDNILNKTKDDLDRIKSTSFFQRVPTASEVKKAEAEEHSINQEGKDNDPSTGGNPDAGKEATPRNIGVVVLSETESEEEGEDEDDIFDTSFVDAVASGEVKLAYIPESPTTEEAEGEDPFDTSIAERAILGPAFNKKGKKLVPLGSAVEVLTGRVELPTCAIKRPSSRRTLKQQQDLLLGSFDLDTNGNSTDVVPDKTPLEIKKTLLDDDAIPLSDAPIDLSGATLYQSAPTPVVQESQADPAKELIAEFDIITKTENATSVENNDDEDDEFALLAAESLAKKPAVLQPVLPTPVEPAQDTWNTFETEFDQENFVEEDPFDTTFAENILPGKAELKLIENEILNADLSNIQPNVEEKIAEIIRSTVSIHVTNPTGERESISSLDRIDESCLTSLQPIHRDLLGGSNTDLSQIGDDPITPNQPVEDSLSDYSDPFDTSIVEQVTAPGQIELKFIEKEILGEVTIQRSLSDPDFDPRAEESEKPHTVTRPEQLDVNASRSVAFVLPSPSCKPDLLATGGEDSVKHTKPLTPYYVRENSLPEAAGGLDGQEDIEDPFDTSFVSELAPGKAELKLLENEFIAQTAQIKHSLSDEDFNPRATEPAPEIQQELPKVIPTKFELPLKPEPQPDLLTVGEEVSAKVLTPAVESASSFELSYTDPFDTSIASNILPGKTELKLIENELIHTEIKRNLTDPDFDPRILEEEQKYTPVVSDILDRTEVQVTAKPLTPVDYKVSFDIGGDNDIDPFDTSVADNLVPGRTELKLLESELI